MPKPTAVTLKLNGRPLSQRNIPPTVRKLIDAFRRWPDDDVFSTTVVAQKLGIPADSIQRHSTREEMADYTERLGPDRYYGNKKAIALMRRTIAERQ